MSDLALVQFCTLSVCGKAGLLGRVVLPSEDELACTAEGQLLHIVVAWLWEAQCAEALCYGLGAGLEAAPNVDVVAETVHQQFQIFCSPFMLD